MRIKNTHFRFVSVTFAAMFGLYSTPAIADCDSVLRDGAFSRESIQSDSYTRTVFAARLASMTYEQAKNETSGGLSLPIEGIPLGVDFSQSEFREFQTSVRSSIDVDATNSHSSSILRVKGDSEILGAWSLCKAREGGLVVTVQPRGPTTVEASIEWWPTPGSSNSPVMSGVHVDGGTVQSGEDSIRSGVELGIRHKRLITIKREPEGAVLVTVSTSFMDESAYLPRVYTAPSIAPIVQRYAVGECTGAGGVQGVHFWGPTTQYCNGIAEWGRYSASEQSVTSLGSCKGRGGVEGVTLYGPVGSLCAGIPVWGSYEGSMSLDNGIGSCVGRGNILAGHLLFGPKGLNCGGIPEWGKYQ